MIEVATANINSFASGRADFVQPSDQLITLTYGQLQDLIQEAIERATTPLESRIESLERKVGSGEGGEDAPDSHKRQDNLLQIVLDLRANMALKGELEVLQEITARERAYDRQRIAKLERVEPQPLQKDRGEILRALIATNGGKMLAKDARQKMRISKSSFSQLLATMKDGLGIKGYHQDRRNLVLFIK